MRWLSLLLVITLVVSLFSSFCFVSAVSPSGAQVTPGTSSSAPSDSAGSVAAIAGNVTEINIFGFTNTQSWQGYFGNVTGTIQLADSSDNVMYNWSLASPRGEIYASTSNSLTWTGIQCFDMQNDLTALETAYGIDSTDVDGVDETFNRNDHAGFYTNNIQFTGGQCNNTKVFGPSGAATFDEVLMSDGANTIFTSLLLEDAVGFDDATHDFEMLVLENGHGTDTSTSTYYFWVELE